MGGGRQLLGQHMEWESFLPPRRTERPPPHSHEEPAGVHHEAYGKNITIRGAGKPGWFFLESF